MQMQSLKLRLNQLKKASVSLKSKVLQQSSSNSLSLSELIVNVLPYVSQPTSSYPISLANTQVEVQQNRKQNTNYLSNNSLIYSPNSSISTPPPLQRLQEPIQPLKWNSSVSSQQSSPSRQAIQIEIERLKIANDQLESKIQFLSSEVSQLKISENEKQQQSWKLSLPFINKQGSVLAFTTRLQVRDYDLDRIDYEPASISLIYQRLTIKQDDSDKVFHLEKLGQVKYFGDYRMRVEFKDDETYFVYLEFASKGQRQEWDLALFVNSKIENERESNRKLFYEEKQQKMNFSKSKSSLKGQDDKFAQFRILQKVQKKGVRFNQRKNENSHSLEKDSFHNSMRKSEVSVSIDKSNVQYTLNNTQYSPEHFQGQQFTSSGISVVSSNRDKEKEKQLRDFVVFGDVIVGESNHQQPRANTSRFNAQQINFQTNIELYPTFTQTPNDNLTSQNDWERGLKELKQGYFFTKYARNGFKPHNKKVFISNQQQMLVCADSEEPNHRKAIPIENISSVKYPALGEGVNKHLKNPRVENFCTIDYHIQGKPHVLELGCNRTMFIKRFSEQIREFLRRKGILIND